MVLNSRAIVLVTAGVALFAAPDLVRAAEKSDSKVKTEVKAERPDADGKQTVTVNLKITNGWHLYANPVKGPVGVWEENATRLEFHGPTGRIEAAVDYPKGDRVTVGPDAFNIYKDSVAIKATLQRPKSGELTVRIRVNACNEGSCLLPGTITLKVP